VGKVLIVDDGLGEPARRVLEERGAHEAVELALTGGNRGKGHAIAVGIGTLLSRRPRPRAVLTVDADGQHPPERIPAFLVAGASAELVVGDRFGELARMPPERRAANWLANRILRLATGTPVRDTQCGMRLLQGRALHEIPFAGGGYEAEARHLKRCLVTGVRVAWVPIPAIYEGAPSSFRAARDTMRVAAALLR
jgi:dolichol-phosphate mannosyltransferase